MRNPDWPMMRMIMSKPFRLRVWGGMLITMIRELKWETHIVRDEDDYEQTVKSVWNANYIDPRRMVGQLKWVHCSSHLSPGNSHLLFKEAPDEGSLLLPQM